MPRTDVPQIRSPDLLGRDEVDEKALIGLRAWSRKTPQGIQEAAIPAGKVALYHDSEGIV